MPRGRTQTNTRTEARTAMYSRVGRRRWELLCACVQRVRLAVAIAGMKVPVMRMLAIRSTVKHCHSSRRQKLPQSEASVLSRRDGAQSGTHTVPGRCGGR